MSVTDGDRERARELAEAASGGAWEQEFERGDHEAWDRAVDAIAQALADERKGALLRAAESLKFTPLSQRESGVLSEYTQGIHAAAQIITLLAEARQ